MKWVLKTSSIRVADSEGDQVYRSLEDVPPELRDKIRDTLEGPNAQTVLIANQEAYDRVIRQIHELPSKMQPVRGKAVAPRPAPGGRATPNWRWVAAGIFAAGASLGALWLWIIQSGRS